jgi:hypothetical protein
MTVIKIINKSDIHASWFCYNSYDDSKGIALWGGSGDLPANGGSFTYEPPKNSTDNYYVRFTHKGSLTEIAGCYTGARRDVEVTFAGKADQYTASYS